MDFFKTKFTGVDQVWLLLHSFELTTTIMSLGYHAAGVYGHAEEPIQHNLFCCGVFFVFLLYEFIDITRILTGGYASHLFLFIMEMFAASAFFIAAMVTMHSAEIDIHLQYIDQYQEQNHPFFKNSKIQSVTCICASTVHLLHCCLLFDVYLSYKHLLVPQPGEDYMRPYARRVAVVPSKKKYRLTQDQIGIMNVSIDLAKGAVILGLCHQRFEPLHALQEKLKVCCKWRERHTVNLSWLQNANPSQFSNLSSSVRFTDGFV